MPSEKEINVPKADSPSLQLTQPTLEERKSIWTLDSTSWRGPLNLNQYLERQALMTTAALAKDDGLTIWILVDKNAAPNQRAILSSCETIRKRALVQKDGKLTEVFVHGIGSVFCDPKYRGKGYASRMLRDLKDILRTWQAEGFDIAGSALWSDIGKLYYAGHGWHAFPSDHVEFQIVDSPPHDCSSDTVRYANGSRPLQATELKSEDLETLCQDDESMIKKSLQCTVDGKTQVAIIPDIKQIQWFLDREDFVVESLLGRKASIRGAIVGENSGSRMWALWTRIYDEPIESSHNVLTILRLVVEGSSSENSISNDATLNVDEDVLQKRTEQLKAIMLIARDQAREWKLSRIELWNPPALLRKCIERSGLPHTIEHRETASIPSLAWYGEGRGGVDEIEWVGNEKYCWF